MLSLFTCNPILTSPFLHSWRFPFFHCGRIISFLRLISPIFFCTNHLLFWTTTVLPFSLPLIRYLWTRTSALPPPIQPWNLTIKELLVANCLSLHRWTFHPVSSFAVFPLHLQHHPHHFLTSEPRFRDWLYYCRQFWHSGKVWLTSQPASSDEY